MSVAIALDDAGGSEAEILRRVRDGDHAAFAVLYERHIGRARRLARSILSSSADADDVVSEVFAASFAALRRGKGPADAFGPYVLTSVRRECYRSWRKGARRGETAQGDIEPAADDDDLEERAVLEQAFTDLPSNLRNVLWLTEVEGLSHAEVAGRTGSTSQAVAVMAVRARRSLAERYLQAHVAGAGAAGRECLDARRGLAQLVRGSASRRQQRRVADHLSTCPDCEHAEGQLRLINQRLRTLAPPASLAVVASRVVATGLRARLGAWLLAPAAPLTAATTLVVAGVALTASTSGAGDVVTMAEPPAVEQALDPAGAPADAAAIASRLRVTSRLPAVAGLTSVAEDPPMVSPAPAGSLSAEGTPLVLPLPALPEVPAVPPIDVAVPLPVEVEVPLPEVGLDVAIDVPLVPVGGPIPVEAGVTTGADGVSADVGVGPAEVEVEVAPDAAGLGVDGLSDLVDPLLPGG